MFNNASFATIKNRLARTSFFNKNIHINKRVAIKSFHISLVGSKQLNDEVKTTLKILSRTRQAAAGRPTIPATEENSENLIQTMRKIVREEVENHKH